MSRSRDHYEVYELDDHASSEAIERSYRRQAVIEHRRGIFRLEERLRRMGEIARNLMDPENRRRHREQRAFAQTALLRLPPSEDGERARRDGRRLRDARRELGDASVRMSIDAVSANADEMREVAFEHADRERTRKRALARRALVSGVFRMAFYATLLGLAFYFWSRH